MKREIRLKAKKIEYELKKSKRAKRLRLAIYCDGSFVVVAPKNLMIEKIEDYIFKKTEWILEKLKVMEKRKQNPVFSKRSKKEFLKVKAKAQELAEKKVVKFNRIYGFKFNKIFIKNQKTIWGSCSKKGNLNYNYKVALLPEKLADYIIVHELCHLKEFNHSRKFWQLVEKAMPDYRERIKEIKEL